MKYPCKKEMMLSTEVRGCPGTGTVRRGRKGRSAWERRIEHAIRNLNSVWDLMDNSLCRLSAVQELCRVRYAEKISGAGFALRDLVAESVEIAAEMLPPPYGEFLGRWAKTGNIAAVAREMGKDRSHLSRSYRPRVVAAATSVFLQLVKSRRD